MGIIVLILQIAGQNNVYSQKDNWAINGSIIIKLPHQLHF